MAYPLSLPERRRPTAIAAANDLPAFGLLARARERGIEVPRGFCVAGFVLTYSGEERGWLLTERDRRYAALDELLDRLPLVGAGSEGRP